MMSHEQAEQERLPSVFVAATHMSVCVWGCVSQGETERASVYRGHIITEAFAVQMH